MTNEEAVKLIQEIEEDGRNVTSEHIKALNLATNALETGEVYMTGEDYNLYIEGYKAGKNDFAPKQGEWGKHGECPFCSYIRQWEDDKFCGNCGAELQNKTENNKE